MRAVRSKLVPMVSFVQVCALVLTLASPTAAGKEKYNKWAKKFEQQSTHEGRGSKGRGHGHGSSGDSRRFGSHEGHDDGEPGGKGNKCKKFRNNNVVGSFVDPRHRNRSHKDDEEPDLESAPGTITRPAFESIGTLTRLCGCTNTQWDFEPEYHNIRDYSNEYMKNGDVPSSMGLTNLVWAWGQFLDHDVVGTVDLGHDSKDYDITMTSGEQTGTMKLFRLDSESDGSSPCRLPKVITTPIVDAGPVYGPNEAYLQQVLRQPGTCKLRMSEGNLLPVTTEPDPVTGKHFFVAGDVRVNEHAVLTSLHTVWAREHNRICRALEWDPRDRRLSTDEKFEKARKIVTAKFQQITVQHFLPALGLSRTLLKNHHPLTDSPDISAEFDIAYRFGHDMIPDQIGDFATVSLFDGEKFYKISSNTGSSDPAGANAALDKLLSACGSVAANQIDGKVSNTLRNTLFGAFGEDLASRNIFRGRDMGLPGYGALAKCFGVKPNKQIADTSDDAFPGLLRENDMVGYKAFGPTMTKILADQFHRIFYGAGGSWWQDDFADEVRGWEHEIVRTTLASVIEANSGAKVKGTGFKTVGKSDL